MSLGSDPEALKPDYLQGGDPKGMGGEAPSADAFCPSNLQMWGSSSHHSPVSHLGLCWVEIMGCPKGKKMLGARSCLCPCPGPVLWQQQSLRGWQPIREPPAPSLGWALFALCLSGEQRLSDFRRAWHQHYQGGPCPWARSVTPPAAPDETSPSACLAVVGGAAGKGAILLPRDVEEQTPQ